MNTLLWRSRKKVEKPEEAKEVVEEAVKTELVEEKAVEEAVGEKTTNEVLEKFQEEVELTRQKVLSRLSEMNTQNECIKVLSVVKKKLDQKNGDKVSITFKGYGKYSIDGEEIIIDKYINMELMIKVVDMIPAFCRDEPTTTIEPKVSVWFSETTE